MWFPYVNWGSLRSGREDYDDDVDGVGDDDEEGEGGPAKKKI